MTIKEFLKRKYAIKVELKVLEEHDYDTEKLLNRPELYKYGLDNLIGDEFDSWVDDNYTLYILYDNHENEVARINNPNIKQLIDLIHSLK